MFGKYTRDLRGVTYHVSDCEEEEDEELESSGE